MKTRHRRGLYAPELLEARIAPATLVVTSLADPPIDTAGTLRHAIGLANDPAHVGADTITFAPALFPSGAPGTILLIGGAEIVISDTLTIKGPGPDLLTITANDASRIFNIFDSDNTVLHPTVISGLTLRDGHTANSGGAITSTESLTLTNVVLHSNYAGVSGGAVYVQTEGKVVITNVKFTDNTANSESGGGQYAQANGGILVTKSLVSGNSAGNRGGGMYLRVRNAKATIVVDATSFIGNSAADNGGGLHLQSVDAGKITVKNSTFTGNTTTTDGGGLYLNDGLLTVDRTVFAHNSATEDGGAIAGSGSGLKITNSRFDRNTAGQEGGALYAAGARPVSITGSVFTGNQSTTSGGAIHGQGGVVLTVKTSTFSGNMATTDGGAISAKTGAKLTVTGGTFAGNEATNNGGAIDLGGAGTSLLLAASTVSGNTAIRGGGIYADTGALLTVTGGSFIGNLARDAAATDGSGGGISTGGFGVNAVNLSVTGTLFQANRAIVDGGAIFTSGDGSLFLKNARVLGNFAGGDGGGTNLRSSTAVTVIGSLFQHNVSGDNGGGTLISLLSATAVGTVTSSKFLDNFADFGGGLDIFGSAGAVLTVQKSLISGNLATTEGGGLRKSGASPTLTLIANLITGNWAPTGPNIFQ